MGNAKSTPEPVQKANTVYSLEFRTECEIDLENPEFWRTPLENVMRAATTDLWSSSYKLPPPIYDIEVSVVKKKRYTSGVIVWRSVMTDEYELSKSLTFLLRSSGTTPEESYRIIPRRYKYSQVE